MTVKDPFVTAEWLLEHPHAVVADCRWYLDGRSAREAYESGHLPGARFVDLDTELSAPPGRGGRHPLPTPETFARAMRRIGVCPDSLVVACDDTGGATAGRLWWMLDSTGVDCRVLVGGIRSHDGELEVGPDDGPEDEGTFSLRQWPAHRFATAADVARAVADAVTVVIDARSSERFEGQENPIDLRFGHVPGARSIPALDMVDGGRPRSATELADRFEQAGIRNDTPVVAYCGSGVSACLDLLGLRRTGHREARLYVGSWSEWGADPQRPVATGPTS